MKLLLFTLLNSVVLVVIDASYLSTCKNTGWNQGNRAISAHCADDRGGWHYTELPVSWFATNDDGRIRWYPNGNAMNLCQMTFYKPGGSAYEFDCPARNGVWMKKTCELNDHIHNDWGNLRYDGYNGAMFCYDWNRMAGNETEKESEPLTALPVTTTDDKAPPVATKVAIATGTGKPFPAGKRFTYDN